MAHAVIDLVALHRTFTALREFVSAEPELAAFHDAAVELELQAARLASGARDLPRLAETPDRRIANRTHAARIVQIMNGAPPLDGTESEELRHALAMLFGNLVLGITHPILRDHAELMWSS